MRCRCGNSMHDDSDASYVIRRDDFDVDALGEKLLIPDVDLWRCGECGRIWVFWDTFEPSEYLPAEGVPEED